jgi:hypothetical protein
MKVKDFLDRLILAHGEEPTWTIYDKLGLALFILAVLLTVFLR